MNKPWIIIVALVVIIVAAVGYSLSRNEDGKAVRDEQPEVVQETPSERGTATFSDPEAELAFDYPTGARGYVVVEATTTDATAGLLKHVILYRTEDHANLSNIPEGGEGPPIIGISIFTNTQKEDPPVWADEHEQYTNINLKTSEPAEVTIGGANAIRYRADGLYPSENAVVASGSHVYVLTGQYLEQDSDIRRDFDTIVNSIRFIPAPGQE